MTAPQPKTAAEARKLISDLTVKRVGLVGILDSSASRRKGHATAAEFGSADAAAILRRIEAEDTAARGALQNLDLVIAEMKVLCNELAAEEQIARDLAEEDAVAAAVDAILLLGDDLDKKLEEVRELFAKRRAALRNPILRNAGVHAGTPMAAMVMRDREMGETLLSYFDSELHYLRAGEGYASLVPVAVRDGKHFGKQSPAQIARGPRKLSPFQRALKAEADKIGWANRGGSGLDSTVEAAKHAARKRPRNAMEADQEAFANRR